MGASRGMTVWGKGPYTPEERAMRATMKWAGITPSQFELEDEGELRGILATYRKSVLKGLKKQVQARIENLHDYTLSEKGQLEWVLSEVAHGPTLDTEKNQSNGPST